MPKRHDISDGMHTRPIQAACNKLVFDLYAAGITGAQLQEKLGLLPRKPLMRFALTSQGDSDIAIAERTFVQQMHKLGVKERKDIYIGHACHGWSDFPETHDCLCRSFARLERSLEVARINDARRKELESRKRIAPVSHGPANLIDILGTSVQTPNSPQPRR